MSGSEYENADVSSSTPNPSQAKSDIEQRALDIIDGVPSLAGGRVVSNFTGSPLERWKFAAACLGAECRDGKTALGEVINLRFYYITTIPQENEQTGEMQDTVYVVLSDGVKAPVGFWSPYVARDLGRMILALGSDDLGDGVQVKVVESNKPGKRAFYGLVPA